MCRESEKKNDSLRRRSNPPSGPVLRAGSSSIASRLRRGETPKRIGPVASDFITKNVIVPDSAVHDGCQMLDYERVSGKVSVPRKRSAPILNSSFCVLRSAFIQLLSQEHGRGSNAERRTQ